MPITADELTQYGRSSIDLYLRNDPIDSINPERPLLKKLMEERKEIGAGKQYLVSQVRKGNDSNFQDFYGSDSVDYNRKDTLDQSKYEYVNFHDGYSMHEDDFIRNGVTIGDGPGKQATASEKETITNLFEENNETLREGCEESLDISLHVSSGVALTTLVPKIGSNPVSGLAEMIPFDATSTYASINRTGNGYWQNYFKTGVTVANDGATTDIIIVMRQAWRACVKYGGRPNCILVGSNFLDQYIDYMLRHYGRVNYTGSGTKAVEGAEGSVTYMGVPLVWDPTFDTLEDASIDNTVDWKDRCYFLNTKFLKMKPIKNQWMVSRVPPRTYNKYEYYWALTSRFYLINTRPTAHAVIALA